MSGPFNIDKFSTYVNAIVDRRIRPLSMSITGSVSYLKQLITQVSNLAISAQNNATAAQTAATNSATALTSSTLIYNTLSSTFLGVQNTDPTNGTTGNNILKGAWYIRASDNRLRVATNVTPSGVPTWNDATVVADAASIRAAGANVFLTLNYADPAGQTVTGLVNFTGTTLVKVADLNSTQAIQAVQVKNLFEGVSNAVNAENGRATQAERTIVQTLNNEVTRASGAESQLSQGIATEIQRATQSEAALQALINSFSNLFSSNSVAFEGFYDLPGNLRIQWGRNRISTNIINVWFDQYYNQPFSGPAFAVAMFRWSGGADGAYNQKHYSKTSDGDGNRFVYQLHDNDSGNSNNYGRGFDWIALGRRP